MEPVVIAVRKPFEYTLTSGEATTVFVVEEVLEPVPDVLDVEVDWEVEVVAVVPLVAVVLVVAVVPEVTFVCVPDAPLEVLVEPAFD